MNAYPVLKATDYSSSGLASLKRIHAVLLLKLAKKTDPWYESGFISEAFQEEIKGAS